MDKDKAIAELAYMLQKITEWADWCIPEPEGGLSNAQLIEAENDIAASFALIDKVERCFKVLY